MRATSIIMLSSTMSTLIDVMGAIAALNLLSAAMGRYLIKMI